MFLSIFLLSLTISTSFILSLITPTPAQAATSNTLNFQGRLLTATGGLVPDGTYNMEFNLYYVAAAGVSQWTEDRLVSNTQGVTVRNGYYSVYLGQYDTIPALNWSEDLYLGMTIRGTTNCAWGSCSPLDAQMTPRFKLTAVPYAFRAANVASSNTNVASTNSDGVSITTGNATGATSSSGNLTVYTGSGTTNSGNISVDVGNGTSADGTITLGGVNASSLILGRTGLTTSNAGSLTVAQALTVTGLTTLNGGLTVETGDTFTFNADAFTDFTGGGLVNTAGVLSVDTTSATGFFRQGGNSFTATAILGTNDANILSLETTNTSRFQIAAASSTLTGQGATTLTSTAALTLSSAAASNLDITTGTTGALTLDSGTTGAINIGVNANAKTITLGNSTGATSLVLNAGTGNIDIGANTVARTITVGNTTGASALTLQSGTGALNLQTQGTGGVNIATNAVAQTVTLGNSTGATSLVLNAGTGNIDIGANAIARTINIGTGAAVVQTINMGGTGANVIGIGNTQTAGSISLGAAMTGGTISIGGTGLQTGTISLGTGTGAQAINLGTGGTGAKTVTLGSTASTGTTTINAGSGGITLGAATTINSTLSVTGASTLRGLTVNNATATDDQIATSITTGGAARFTGTITNTDLTAARTYTLPNASGEFSVLGQTIENVELANSSLTVNTGSGLTGGGSISLGSSRNLALGALTADWVQNGGFDIILDNAASELRILESSGGLYYGEFDVGDLSATRLYTFPNASGEVTLLGQTIENGELANSSVTVNSGTGLSGGGLISLGGSLSLSVNLGDDITGVEVVDNTIEEVDLEITNAVTNGYILSADTATGGFTWINPGTLNTGGVDTLNGLAGALSIVGNTQLGVSAAGSNVNLIINTDSITTSQLAANSVDASELVSTSVGAASYGSASSVATFTVDADGRLTTAATTSIQLNGNQITSGSVGDSFLTSNVALLTGLQIFTGAKTFSATLSATAAGSGLSVTNNASVGGTLTVGDLTCTNCLSAAELGTDSVAADEITAGAVTGSELLDNTIEEVDLELTNAPTDDYILTYDLATGGFTWVDGGTLGVTLTEAQVEDYIFDADNGVKTLSSGTLALNSLTYTGNLNVAQGGTGLTGAGAAGGVYYSSGTAFANTGAGTAGQCLLSGGAGVPTWGICGGGGAGATTLQVTYDNGNAITTTDNRNILFTLADTTTDSNFLTNIATSSTGRSAIQLNGTDLFRVDSNGIDLIDVDVADFTGATVTFDAGEIDETEIAQDTLDDSEIANDILTAGSLAANSVDASELASTTVAVAAYGSASSVATFTVDADGRLTTASSTAIALNASAITAGTLSTARGGTGLASFTANGVLYASSTSALTQATGTSAQILLANASGVPTFTSLSGDVAITNTGLTTIAANSVALTTDTTGDYVAANTAGTGISITGIPGEAWSPTVALSYGNTLASNTLGSSESTFSTNGLLLEGSVSDAFETFITVTNPTADQTITLPNASGTVAVSASGNIALSAVGDLTVTGQIPVANGGTGVASITAGGILFGNGSSAVTNSGVLANGQLLIGDGSGVPTVGTLTQSTGITVTNGAGTITIASTLGTTIEGSELTDNTIEEVDLEVTNAPTNGYVLSYDSASGGFTWLAPGAFATDEATVESYIFDADNTGTLSSGTLALNSLSYTGTLSVGSGGTGLGSAGAAGGIYYSTGSAFANSGAGTAGNCLLSNGVSAPSWGSCGGGGGPTTLQVAYDNGASITTTDNKNIAFNLADTATDSDFIVNLLGTGSLFDVQDGGTSKLTLDGSNGFLGVNDSTPSYQLDVAGDGRFTNNLLVDGNTTLGNASTDLINFTGVANTSLLANNAAGGTARTTEATARTNVTTVTITVAGYANGDVIYINNAGQDYYTRITAGGGTTSLTVDPAVSYDVSAPVSNYTIQNVGASSTGTSFSNNNRFFQGYFLGGVVTGAGSTTLSDGSLSSTNNLNVVTSGTNSLLGYYNSGLNSPTQMFVRTDGTQSAQQSTLNLMTSGGANGVVGVAGSRGWHIAARGNAYTTASEQNDLIFYNWNGASFGTVLALDSATNNIGVGTSAPGEKLTVRNSDDSTSTILSVYANNLTQGVGLHYNGIRAIGSNTDVSLNLSVKGAGTLNFTGVETASLTLNGGYTELTVPSLLQIPNGLFVSGATAYFTNQLQARGGVNNDGGNLTLSASGGNILTSNQVQAPIYFDINNTGYYLNPDGQSNLERVDFSYGYDRNNTGYYIDLDNTTRINAISANSIATTSISVNGDGVGACCSGYHASINANDNPTLQFHDGGTAWGNIVYNGTFTFNNGPIVATGNNIVAGNYLSQGNFPVGGGTYLCQGAFGTISICTSSRRYKTDIQDAPWTLDTIRQMRPVTYTRIENGKDEFGFIAEEINEIDSRFGVYHEGRLEGVNYAYLTSVLASGIKELDVQVQANNTRLDVVEAGNFSGNLTVAGNAQFIGNLKVSGTTELANLQVTGLTELADLKVDRIISKGNTPTAVLGVSTTGQGSTYTIEGNDTAGTISITTGTNSTPPAPATQYPLASGEQVTVTFNVPFTATPRVTLTPTSENAANIRYYVLQTGTEFKLVFTEAPVAGATYSFNYQIIQ